MNNDTPILNTLKEYLSKKPIRMHVPFHNGIPNNTIIPPEAYNIDISEVSGYDSDGNDNPIYLSEKITSDFFNVEHSFYLVNGASSGLIAALIALNKFGKKVIVARNVHKSVVSGLVLSGLEPVWLEVEFLKDWGVFGKINIEKLENILSEESDIAGCVIVNPTYEGVFSDIESISELCHKKNIPLVLDEAHGAHSTVQELTLSTQRLTFSHRADIVIQSWHKTLGSLTQSGVLHLVNNNFFSYKDIKRSLDLITSTSPSFLLLLSLELTRKNLIETDSKKLFTATAHGTLLKKEILKIKGLKVLENNDSTKIYLKHENCGGIDFAYDLFSKFHIEVESANEIGFLIQVGAGFNEDQKEKLLYSLKHLSEFYLKLGNKNISNVSLPDSNSLKISPREAFMAGFKKNKIENVECEINAPCPPGYVLNVPGAELK